MKTFLTALALAVAAPAIASAGTITTGFTGANGASGNMFDVLIGGSALTVTDIEVHVDETIDTTLSFWYREGSYVGFENDGAAWTLLDSALLSGAGEGSPTAWDLADLSLDADTRYAFFIHDSQSAIGYRNQSGEPDAVVAANGDISIFTGLGRGQNSSDPFAGGIFQGRAWEGTLNYGLDDVAPVPLPAGLPLMLVGLGALGLLRRARG